MHFFLCPLYLTCPIVLLSLIALPVVEKAETEPEGEDAGEEETAAQRAQDLPASDRHKATSRDIFCNRQQCRHLEVCLVSYIFI